MYSVWFFICAIEMNFRSYSHMLYTNSASLSSSVFFSKKIFQFSFTHPIISCLFTRTHSTKHSINKVFGSNPIAWLLFSSLLRQFVFRLFNFLRLSFSPTLYSHKQQNQFNRSDTLWNFYFCHNLWAIFRCWERIRIDKTAKRKVQSAFVCVFWRDIFTELQSE